MPQWLEKLKAKPWIAHVLRMQERFTQRLGNQFAAAITYFSVLSLVPVLMFGFAMLGMVLTVFRPDLLDEVRTYIAAQFAGNQVGPQITGIIENALNNWATIGVISIAIFAWSGANWVANLKSAIRAQMRRDLTDPEKKANIAVETLTNLGILIVLLLSMLAMFSLSSVATVLTSMVIEWLHLPESIFTVTVLRLVPILVNLAVGFGMFAFLYRASFHERISRPAWKSGALVGAIGFVVLQFLTTLLFGIFSGNAAATIFGPVITLMLFFNLFATLILMVAAWMATWEPERTVRSPMAEDVADAPPELAEPVPMVRQAVAEKAMRAGLGTGWVLGAATGVGLGAIVAGVLSWFARVFRRS